jgi:hypothetical protein
MNIPGTIPEPDGLVKRAQLGSLAPGLYLIEEPLIRRKKYDPITNRLIDGWWQPLCRIAGAELDLPGGLNLVYREDGCTMFFDEWLVNQAEVCSLVEPVD